MTDDTKPGQQSSDEYLRESLSALMDGEATDMEQQRILRSCQQDEALRTTWSRYQFASTLVRRQSCDVVSVSQGFAGRVIAALEQEEVQPPVAGWRQGIARFAVAASVAVIVVAGVQWQQRNSQDALSVVAAATEPSVTTSATQAATVASAPSLLSGQPAGSGHSQRQQVQFEGYMQYHLERASLNDNRGMVPLAPKVSAGER